jgi:hypothetical protein
LTEFQDVVAETSQGFAGKQYGVNEIRGRSYNFNSALQALRSLDETVNTFENLIKSIEGISGILNAVNDFQQTVQQYKYLFRLAMNDGENVFVK